MVFHIEESGLRLYLRPNSQESWADLERRMQQLLVAEASPSQQSDSDATKSDEP